MLMSATQSQTAELCEYTFRDYLLFRGYHMAVFI